MAEDSPLVVVMNTVAAALAQPGDVGQTLGHITDSAKLNIPDADYVSISFRRGDQPPQTLASTDPITVDLDTVQFELQEGPSYDVVTVENVTYSGHLAHDPRWPLFGPRADAVGVKSQMAIGLHADARSRTGLNLYSRQVGAFDIPDDLIALFASHARVALGFAREVDTLTVAVSTRKIIGQAIGIIRERYDLNEDRAFEFLVRVSQTSNVKLRMVAEQIVSSPAGGSLPKRPAGARTGRLGPAATPSSTSLCAAKDVPSTGRVPGPIMEPPTAPPAGSTTPLRAGDLKLGGP